MQTPQTPTEQSCPPTFEEHAKHVIQNMRTSLAELLSAVGANPTRSQDMARRLGVNKNLAWKISKIVGEDDPFAVPANIPGRSGVNIFIKSVEKAGAPTRAVASARQAFEAFEQLIDLHSGDRETLTMMLGSLTRAGQQERDETHRRIAFRGNCAIWGVQAHAQLCVNFIAPSKDNEEMVDLAWLSGLVDFRRLRQEACWAMASARKIADDGTVLPVDTITAIDPNQSGDHKAPLLSEFCSKPTPEVRIVPGPDGLIRYELVEGPVGNTAALSCIIGLHGRSFMRRWRAENDTIGEHAARLYTPTECLIHDLFVHEELDYAMGPSIHLYSQMPGGPMYPASGRDVGMLPLRETVHEVSGPAEVVTPELPDYHRMLSAVVTQLGWDAGKFRGFRLKMRYPPIPTLAVFRYDLTDRP